MIWGEFLQQGNVIIQLAEFKSMARCETNRELKDSVVVLSWLTLTSKILRDGDDIETSSFD